MSTTAQAQTVLRGLCLEFIRVAVFEPGLEFMIYIVLQGTSEGRHFDDVGGRPGCDL